MRTGNQSSQQALRQVLHDEVMRLSFPAFSHLMQQLLLQCGYSAVRRLRRNHPRGRTPHGGVDLMAYTATDVAATLTIVQVKQYWRPVSRRFVDELRGTLVRLGAAQGLLLSTSMFSKVARRSAAHSDIAPILLIDGEEILNLLMQHNIGVKEGQVGQWVVDTGFFANLQKAYPKKASTSKRVAANKLPSSTDAEVINTNQTNTALKVVAEEEQKGGELTWSTHALIGINTLWLFELMPRDMTLTNIGFITAVTVMGALLPDLDAAESKIKHLSLFGVKPLFLPAQVLHQVLGHRGVLHSLLGLAVVSVLAMALIPLVGTLLSFALALGYFSHLLADACTKAGIAWFYPMRRRYHLLPKAFRLTTGSQVEDLVFVVAAAGALLLLLHFMKALTSL